MEELKQQITELRKLMTPDAIQDLNDEEISNVKALIEKLKSIIEEDA